MKRLWLKKRIWYNRVALANSDRDLAQYNEIARKLNSGLVVHVEGHLWPGSLEGFTEQDYGIQRRLIDAIVQAMRWER
jgi:hypothetical protein